MSRLIFVLLLLLGTQGLFVASCGDADRITLQNQGTDEVPSADENEGESGDDEENTTGVKEEPEQVKSVIHGSEWCVGRPSSC